MNGRTHAVSSLAQRARKDQPAAAPPRLLRRPRSVKTPLRLRLRLLRAQAVPSRALTARCSTCAALLLRGCATHCCWRATTAASAGRRRRRSQPRTARSTRARSVARAARRGAAGGRARAEGPAAGGRTRTSARCERARQEREIGEARRSGSARRAQDSEQDTLRSRRTRTRSDKRGRGTHGAWDGARDAEFGSARTVQEADV